ncbi:hypothetical protein AN477_21530 [Alicyclobacillus ferrooxydans]|uniref:Peptidoglycan hydrolase PcsB coiled-coil domain-containing protein n=1 Tax=Alicyclobacillus ferrooxydans TaxID=471514 RepID=A0A0N8PN91_9BACL|nr:hypothetical protein AN477_21530 [Alicyclobacillus ferrooxydans]
MSSVQGKLGVKREWPSHSPGRLRRPNPTTNLGGIPRKDDILNTSKKLFLWLGTIVLCMSAIAENAYADSLSQAQQQKQQIQHQITQDKNQIQKQQNVVSVAENQAKQSQTAVQSLNAQILQNESQTEQITENITLLTTKIKNTEIQLNKNRSDLQEVLRAEYEDGQVPYLAVLFGATSFSDLLSRFQMLSDISKSQNRLLKESQALQKELLLQEQNQKQNYVLLVKKGRALYTLKQQATSQEALAQQATTSAKRQVNALSQAQRSLAKKLNLTDSEIAMLEQQAKQQEEILAARRASSSIVEPTLRYQPISAQKLYAFVKMQGSAFSLSDIETICSVAHAYDVNPALMIAIAGQELDFVPSGIANERWKLENPFDVFGSWALYHTTIAQSAAYAAQFLQVKLSVAPPAGIDPIIWINDPSNHEGGVYATDPHWAYGVRMFFNEISSYVHS